MTARGEWDCEAYGPELREVGALCFFADPGTRNCYTEDECRQSVVAARQLVYRRMNELAAAGDEAGAFLAETFTNPEQILGGGEQ